MTVFRFEVIGQPVTQGNKTAFPIKGTGRAVMREGRSKEANDRFKMWRHAVSDEARKARGDGPGHLLDGPVVVTLTFRLPRPASAPKRRRTWPIGARAGDVDKLARAALDAMTGVLFADDGQVVDLHVTKDYGDPGLTVMVADLQADELVAVG